MSLVSVIIPMYNEEKRIKVFFPKVVDFIKNYKKRCEIVLVNDGSSDNTLGIVKELSKKRKDVKIVSYPKNKGKGGAVKEGVMASSGNFIVFIDADGSISPDQIEGMAEKLHSFDVVVGNRDLKDSKAKRVFFRKILSSFFNFICRVLFGTGKLDYLCGFKGFKRDVARKLFSVMVSPGWLFDVELFYLIKKFKFSVYQLPITWVHKGDSKMKAYYPLILFFRLFKLRFKLFSSKLEKG